MLRLKEKTDLQNQLRGAARKAEGYEQGRWGSDPRQGAFRSPGQGKGTSKQGSDAMPKCPVCHSVTGHPECSTCPNGPATYGIHFDRNRAQHENWKCSYDHLRKGAQCRGVGHQAWHHMLCYTPQAEEEVKRAGPAMVPKVPKGEGKGGKDKGKYQGNGGGGKAKGKAKGGGKKGGKQGAKRYDIDAEGGAPSDTDGVRSFVGRRTGPSGGATGRAAASTG